MLKQARRSRRRQRSGTNLLQLLVIVAFAAVVLSAAKNPGVTGVILLLGIAGAIYFYIERNRRRYQRWVNLREVKLLTSHQFEEHVAEFYRQSGYKVKLTPRVGDQGVDVIAERQSERIAIQCKLNSDNVSNDAVQQVLAGKHYYKCSHAVVIASSGFTASAMELAKRSKVELVDGVSYAERMRRLRVTRERKSDATLEPSEAENTGIA